VVADDSAADCDCGLFVESVLDRAECNVYGDDHSGESGNSNWNGHVEYEHRLRHDLCDRR